MATPGPTARSVLQRPRPLLLPQPWKVHSQGLAHRRPRQRGGPARRPLPLHALSRSGRCGGRAALQPAVRALMSNTDGISDCGSVWLRAAQRSAAWHGAAWHGTAQHAQHSAGAAPAAGPPSRSAQPAASAPPPQGGAPEWRPPGLPAGGHAPDTCPAGALSANILAKPQKRVLAAVGRRPLSSRTAVEPLKSSTAARQGVSHRTGACPLGKQSSGTAGAAAHGGPSALVA